MTRKTEVLPSVKIIDIGVEVEDDWYGPVIVFELTQNEGHPALWSKTLKNHVAKQLLKDPMYLDYARDPGHVTIMKDTEFEVSPEMPTAASPKDFSHWMRDRYNKDHYFVSILKQYYEWDKDGYAIPREG